MENGVKKKKFNSHFDVTSFGIHSLLNSVGSWYHFECSWEILQSIFRIEYLLNGEFKLIGQRSLLEIYLALVREIF